MLCNNSFVYAASASLTGIKTYRSIAWLLIHLSSFLYPYIRTASGIFMQSLSDQAVHTKQRLLPLYHGSHANNPLEPVELARAF